MIKHFSVFLLLLVISLESSAQKPFFIKGILSDTSSNLSLENATVTILNSRDSTLVGFVRAKKEGNFLIENLQAGNYILLASYPKYTDFVEKFQLDSGKISIDFGNVNMILVSNLLKDVVITGRNAITIKGDTIEYDPRKFTIQPNSKVEDLLVQLPGIQIDKEGKITAQGQAVNKVLLDGEEFFGDDPTLVTKNIRGDMVDKIQLYDKKSDQAAFSGIDDGKKNKTINIQLKEDSKNGMFGKAEAGVATDRLYQGQAMFNTFKDSRKFATYGTIGNTGKIGLNWQDNNKYSSSDNNDSGGLDVYGGKYNGQGIPLVYSGGMHYDGKWNDQKEGINTNYKIGSIEVDGVRNTINQYNLPTGIITSNSDQNFNNFMFRQKLDITYNLKLDSTSTLKVAMDGTLKNSRSTDNYGSESLNGNNQLLNQSARKTNNESDGNFFRASVLWNKKLRKKGRTVSLNLNQSINKNNTEGFLYSQNEYYDTKGGLDSTQLVDQQKIYNTNNSAFNSNIAYTEPITKYLTVALNYRFKLDNEISNLLSYNRSLNGDYSDLDSLYSNDFKLSQLTNQLGTTLNYNKEKNNLSVGFSAADVNFKQIDGFSNDVMKRSFVNLNPHARWTYKFSGQKSFRFDYSGNTSQPTINQIQPVRGNEDPLNISVGNPDLDPAFKHGFAGVYNSFKVLTEQTLMISLNGSFTSNAIIRNVNTDSIGKSIYQYENLIDHRPLNFSSYIYYGRKLKVIDLNIGGYVNYGNSSFYNIINNKLNETRSNSFSVSLNAFKQVQKLYSVSLEVGPSYTSNISSLQKERSDKGWGFNGNASVTLYLPAKFELFSDANYTFREATQVFTNDFERMIWNGGVRKKFLKTDELILSMYVNDILNQNVGFNRNAYNNVITQSNYTTIKRYCMFSLIWEFNKMGNNNP